jgi:hypothetical protein
MSLCVLYTATFKLDYPGPTCILYFLTPIITPPPPPPKARSKLDFPGPGQCYQIFRQIRPEALRPLSHTVQTVAADLRRGEHIPKMQNNIGRKSMLCVLRQPRRLLRSSRPQEICQPQPRGFFCVHTCPVAAYRK